MRCSLALANCASAQERNINNKAKAWAQTQLRRATTPILKNSNLLEIGEYWGYTAQECTEMMVDKVNYRTTLNFGMLLLVEIDHMT